MNRYKDYFDHLGNRVDQMDAADELVIAACIVCLAILLTALFTGAV
jgi:hypothetical protein